MPTSSSDGHRLGPEQPATNAFIHSVRAGARARRPKVHRTVALIIARYLLPDDAWAVQRCQETALRLTHDAHRADRVVMALCRTVWCDACPTFEHRARTKYQADKIASVIPGNELALGHSVWTLPPFLHPFLRRDEAALTRFRAAVLDTILQAFEVKGTAEGRGRAAGQRELGIVANLHPFGDTATPFPKWAPHLDVLLPAVRHRTGGIERLVGDWPIGFRKTQSIYREELRRQFAPLVRDTLERDKLDGKFKVNLRIVKHDGAHFVRGGIARHKVWYSCRPHFEMSRARLEDPNGPKPILAYKPKGADLIHRRQPRAVTRSGSSRHSACGTVRRRPAARPIYP